MVLWVLIETNSSGFFPKTVFGIIPVILYYVWYLVKLFRKSRLKELKSTPYKDRKEAMELQLNELGVHIDTSVLSAEQIHDLLNKALRAKTRRFNLTFGGVWVTLMLCLSVADYQAFHSQGQSPVKETHLDSVSNDMKHGEINQVDNKPSGIKVNNSESVVCEKCNGTGKISEYTSITCSICGGSKKSKQECEKCLGTGKIECLQCKGTGVRDCHSCHATGKCPNCGGKGSQCIICHNSGKCNTCSGTGKKDCETCKGTKQEDCPECQGKGNKEVTCDNCAGTGTVSVEKEVNCPVCKGTGTLHRI